ncbi:branched-chain amino acid ABC transporter permease [Alloalcanivorax gelatiniphagus]
MDLFAQQIVDGLGWGAFYGALALALVLVFRASGIVNFAQAEMATLGAFVVWQLVQWGVPVLAAVAVVAVVAFPIGAGVERALIRPLMSENHLPVIIMTLGLMLVINSMSGIVWGYLPKKFPTLVSTGVMNVGPVYLSSSFVVLIITVACLAVGLWWLFRRTELGLQMRAAASNADSAQLSGISVGRMTSISWGLAAAVGVLVACLIAPTLFLSPNMLFASLIYAFAAAVLGGMDSPMGALVGGVVVGVLENLAGTYVSWIGNDFKQAVALGLIMVVLLARPQGLFGVRKVARV